MESIREIKDNPELAKELAEALLPYILQSEEFKLMKELREKIDALIENTNKLWQAINKNSEDIRVMQGEIRLLHEDNKRLWEAVNKNSEDIKVMQAALNKNSDEIRVMQGEIRLLHEDNKRLWEAVNKNSDEIRLLHEDNKRLWEAFNKNSDEIRLLHEDNKRLWEAFNKNSEDIRIMQAALNKNSEDIRVMQEEIKLIHEDNKRLWEAVNKNSEDIKVMQAALNKNSDEIRLIHEDNRRIWETIREMNTTLVRIDSTLGAFTGRAGVYIEKTVFEVYREALRLHGVDTSRVRRKNIVDETGVIQKGRRYQVDLIEEDGETYLFEVKNYADNGALDQLDIRRKILEAKGRKVKPFLVANMVEERTKNQAEKQGVTVIAGRIVETPEEEEEEAKTGEN